MVEMRLRVARGDTPPPARTEMYPTTNGSSMLIAAALDEALIFGMLMKMTKTRGTAARSDRK